MKKVFSLFLAFQILFTGNFLVLAEDLPPPSEEEDLEPEPDSEPEPEPPKEDPEEPDPFTIQLNEILADSIEPDAEGEFIEFYNSGGQAIDLSGWHLDDEVLDDTHVYTFDDPQINYVLEPESYLTFFRPETGITLNNDGDAVYLFDDQMDEIDSFVFESSSVGHPWGRNVEDPEQWILLPEPSPNAANGFLNNPPLADIHVQGGTGGMKINVTGENSSDPEGDKLTYLWEFEPGAFNEAENPTTYEFQSPGNKMIKLTVTDAFGLFNEATLPFIASNSEEEEKDEESEEIDNQEDSEDQKDTEEEKIYPKLTLLNEFMPDPEGADGDGEWIEFFNPTAQTVDISGWYLDDEEGASAPFLLPQNTKINPKAYLIFQGPAMKLSLKNSADVVRLLDPGKNESQRIEYADSKEGMSYAKTQENTFLWSTTSTPQALNIFPTAPKAFPAGAVHFESVLPNPEGTDKGKEKILLKNTLAEPIDLSGWKISTSSTESELKSIIIPSQTKKELISEEFGLTLKNTDETLSLFDPMGNLMDQINWKTSDSDQWLFNTNSLQDGLLVQVKEVVDGDTFKIIFEDKTLTVRLLGVDTPETQHPFKPVEFYGKQASDFLKNLISGKQVRLDFDENKVDTYGRVLAYVYLNEQFINAEIIKQGYGYAYTRFPFQFLQDFVTYQAEAKSAEKGLWANAEVAAEIEKTIQENLTKEAALEEGEALVSFDETSTIREIEDSKESVNDSESGIQDNPSDLGEELNCESDFIKIDSFLPYPKKDISEEYIKLINTGKDEICLSGWQLDDVEESGSKPFTFKEGKISPGEILEFDKETTKISLNNSNDCVTLINSSGVVKDQICYGKTHENEVFTHSGGNLNSQNTLPSTTTKKKTSTKTSANSEDAPKHTFNRESSSYRSELTNRSFLGRILGMDEDEKILVVELENKKIIPVSYAYSLFDMKMLNGLLKLDKYLMFEVYQTVDFAHLISVYDPNSLKGSAPEKSSAIYLLLLFPVATLLTLGYKKFRIKNL